MCVGSISKQGELGLVRRPSQNLHFTRPPWIGSREVCDWFMCAQAESPLRKALLEVYGAQLGVYFTCSFSFSIEAPCPFKSSPQRDPSRSAPPAEKHGQHPGGVHHPHHEEVGQGKPGARLSVPGCPSERALAPGASHCFEVRLHTASPSSMWDAGLYFGDVSLPCSSSHKPSEYWHLASWRDCAIVSAMAPVGSDQSGDLGLLWCLSSKKTQYCDAIYWL